MEAALRQRPVSYTHLDVYKRQVSYRVLYGSNRAINMTEVEPQRRISKDGDEGNELSYLFKMICIGKIEDVGQAVDCLLYTSKQRGTKIYEEKICCNHDGSCYGSVNGRLWIRWGFF